MAREEILSQVEDYRTDWNSGDATRRESARRKFERDKNELRQLGVELRTGRVSAGHTSQDVEGYLLKPRDFYLPYLVVGPGGSRSAPRSGPYYLPSLTLAADELPILRRAAERVAQLGDTPLGSAAQSALRKLSFDLPDLPPGAGERTITDPAPPAFAEAFAALRHAVERRQAVQCRYYAIGRDREESRVIEPYGLMLSSGRWYCIARSRERDAIRVFRIDRMHHVAPVAGPDGAFAVPAGFRIDDYLNRAPWELSADPAVTVRVRIGFPQSRWVVSEGLGRVVRAVTEDGGVELEFDVRSSDPFLRWLLPLGSQAEVLEPPGLRRELEQLRARIRALYARHG